MESQMSIGVLNLRNVGLQKDLMEKLNTEKINDNNKI